MFFKSEAHITGWEALFASVLFSLLDSRSGPDTDAGSWSCRCPLGSEVTPLVWWHLPACQDVCREREGATAGAVRLPVASLCWRSYLQWLAWPCCTALFTILSYLSICYFYFKFKEGLVFAKPYLLFLTRLDGLIAKISTSSSQPCTSSVTGSVAFAHSSHWLHWQQGVMCPSTRQVGLKINEICKITSTSFPCFNEMDLLYCSFKFSNTSPVTQTSQCN